MSVSRKEDGFPAEISFWKALQFKINSLRLSKLKYIICIVKFKTRLTVGVYVSYFEKNKVNCSIGLVFNENKVINRGPPADKPSVGYTWFLSNFFFIRAVLSSSHNHIYLSIKSICITVIC